MKKKDLLKRIKKLEEARIIDCEEHVAELKRFEKNNEDFHEAVKHSLIEICKRIKK